NIGFKYALGVRQADCFCFFSDARIILDYEITIAFMDCHSKMDRYTLGAKAGKSLMSKFVISRYASNPVVELRVSVHTDRDKKILVLGADVLGIIDNHI